ncbi:MAG: hypothetical protein V5B30_19310 [Candidatus Accumulibacter delftensis]
MACWHMRAALLAPQRVSGLVLVGTTPVSCSARTGRQHTPALLGRLFGQRRQAATADPAAFRRLLCQGDTKARRSPVCSSPVCAQAPLPDSSTLQRGLEWLRDTDLRPCCQAFTVAAC